MTHFRRALAPGGTFFFTATLADRNSDLLVTEIDRLRAAWRNVASAYPFETVAVCILPDHLHTIWTLPEDDTNYALRWQRIKAMFSKGLRPASARAPSLVTKHEKGLWQRRYWEHQIRDDADLERHVDYIHMNPVKHGHVTQVADWPHSSFHHYVRDGLLPAQWGGSAVAEGAFGEPV